MAFPLKSNLRGSTASLFRTSALSWCALQRRSLTVEAARLEDLEGEHRKEAWIYVDTVCSLIFTGSLMILMLVVLGLSHPLWLAGPAHPAIPPLARLCFNAPAPLDPDQRAGSSCCPTQN